MAIIDTRRGASNVELYEARRATWTPEVKREKDALLSPSERELLPFIWKFWARPNQLLPEDKVDGVAWQTWLLQAGRGFGKTRVGAETVREWVKRGFNYVNIIAPTADDARDVCVEGESGVLNICPKGELPEYVASKRQLQWPNGAISLIFTADEPERLRGKQHMKLWCDELAAWRYLDEAWTQAMLGLRLGANPQAVVTTTPRPLKEIKELIASATTLLTRGTTYENKRNLASAFYSRVITKYEGTRLGRQELDAELLEDRPGALFHSSDIEACRLKSELFWQEIFPKLIRVVGGIDPAATAVEGQSDETGIIFAGMDAQNPPHFYVFDDRSDVLSPERWAKAAVYGYRAHKADKLIGEANNGGDMVGATVHHVDPNVNFKKVHASRGKITRAEPIGALYEQKRVHHVGMLSKLEDQMCDYEPGITDESPDRMDALVWAVTELSENNGELGLLSYLADGGAAAELERLQLQQLAAERAAVVTVSGGGQAQAAAAPVACPECQGALLRKVAGGQHRCSVCGHQWWAAAAPKVFHVTRENYAELISSRTVH